MTGNPTQWTWRQIAQRAGQVVREEGSTSLWFKLLGETVYRRMLLLERRLDEPLGAVTARCSVHLGSLALAEIDAYCRFRPEEDPVQVRQRLSAGQFCFVARLTHEPGEIVHASWAMTGQATGQAWIGYLTRDLSLAPDEVYAYESFTLPAYRCQGLVQARQCYMLDYFRQAGYRRVIVALMPENRLAFPPLEKVGYRPYGVLGYVQVGRWRSDFCRPLRATRRPVTAPDVAGVADVDSSRYWDQVAEHVEASGHYLDPFLGSLKRDAYLSLLHRWGGIPESGRVLKTDLFEEALGPDALLPDLARHGQSVIGIDIAPGTARRAHRRGQDELDGPAHYVAADVRRLPFADRSFALILSPSTLDHFADPHDFGRSLRELARVLAPNGRLVVSVDNRHNLGDPLLRLAARLHRLPYFVGRSYRRDELCAELEAAGFHVQASTTLLHNPRGVAVAAVALARRISWLPLLPLVQRLLTAAQRLEHTRWGDRMGSFVVAQATLREASSLTPASRPT